MGNIKTAELVWTGENHDFVTTLGSGYQVQLKAANAGEAGGSPMEFMLAGATAVGLGTALFYDPMICKKVNAGLLEYLEQQQINSVSELTGALKLPEKVKTCGCDD